MFGIIAGYVFVTRRVPKRNYLASAEYWVFLPDEKMPDQNAVMDRTIGKNPYGRVIGTNEGLLFSDIRLHIALVLRSKNRHAFRPDQFDSAIESSPEMVRRLEASSSFVKVRYVSEDPLPDARHLQFLPHAADAIAELGGGTLIYDVTAERLIRREDLQDLLANQRDVSGPDVHTRVLWRHEIDHGHAETRGMVKMGHPELRTPGSHSDQRVLIAAVLEEAMRRLWLERSLPETLEVEAYDDRFSLRFEPSKDRFALVRIMRVPAV